MVTDKPQIMTVLGPICPDELGLTYMHEHFIADCSFSGGDPEKTYDDEEAAIWEANDSFRAGARTMVDLTCEGLGPDHAALKRIAEATNLHIITSTGFYRFIVYPDYVASSTVDELAERMINNCKNGFGDSGVRAGILGEFASHDPKTPGALGHGAAEPPNEDVEKVFRAAGRTHLATGLPISTHTPRGIGADWEIDIFRQGGVDMSKVVIGHVGLLKPDFEHVRWILDQGVNIAIDGIGYGERDNFDFFIRDKAHMVKTLVEWGHIDQITVSLDMIRKYHLKKYGGHGYAMLVDWFMPLMREVGLSDEQVEQIMIETPKRILTPAGTT